MKMSVMMMKNKTLWIMSGIPGCGKSYVAARAMSIHKNGWYYVSRDEIRLSYLEEGDGHFSHEFDVYSKFIQCICTALKDDAITDVIADATHLNWPSRKKLLRWVGNEINLNKVNIVVVVIESSYKTCLMRNSKRTGRACVPEDVMESMMKSYRHPKTDPFYYDGILEWNNEVEN